ncbi:hypothetical protein PTTG_10690 [Puccinia triticina 1-1 BBBD Race 1]|uniref:Uncharacterized protein n=1 Tax=Puccinia triticina (isolate 1-1 / race 1 (BBBD)) TaxID=630390 RepID=A0A0C4FBU1_PUCT1|nr:hypothetical protein PTTG_10690 [Puccinia triticina 1-1 BBBD Race 1]
MALIHTWISISGLLTSIASLHNPLHPKPRPPPLNHFIPPKLLHNRFYALPKWARGMWAGTSRCFVSFHPLLPSPTPETDDCDGCVGRSQDLFFKRIVEPLAEPVSLLIDFTRYTKRLKCRGSHFGPIAPRINDKIAQLAEVIVA